MNQDETDGEKNTGIGTLYYMQLQYKLYCSTFELHIVVVEQIHVEVLLVIYSKYYYNNHESLKLEV